MELIEIKPSIREWERLVNRGVGTSFCKTLTEPITNSDTSYKRKLNIQMASGLVDEIMKIENGALLDSSIIKKQLYKSSARRQIFIEIATAKGHEGIKSRQCRILDNAEGLDYKTLKEFKEYAGDKTEVSKGRPGRSLFGRGLSDVLLYHEESCIYSVINDEIYIADGFERTSDGRLVYKITGIGNATKKMRGKLHLPEEGNGTCVEFIISKTCNIPSKERQNQLLSNFYMLRLINADSNVEIWLKRYGSQGTIDKHKLEYDFPVGQVIGKFQTKMDYIFHSKKYQLHIDGSIIRSNADLKTTNGDIDERENGILIIDDNDAVMDQTLLPDYEKAPYLKNIYGIVRICGIRELLFDHLEAGKEAVDILTVSREGFDTKQKFTKELFRTLEKQLKPIYDKEKQLYEKRQGGEHKSEVKDLIKNALEPLNQFFKDQTEEIGEGEGDITPDDTKDIQFLPSEIYLRVNRERKINLLINSDRVINDELILIYSDNEKIQVRPDSITIDKKKKDKNGYIKYKIYVLCDEMHQKGNITAITPSIIKGTDLSATLKINDVKEDLIIIPPETMEFRPTKAIGMPNKYTTANLFINLEKIPSGRMIKIEEDEIRGNIHLVEGNKERVSLKITVTTNHEIIKGSIAKVPIPFIGTGKGQHARLVASTKTKGGETVYAIGKIEISEPLPESGGIFEKTEYEPIEHKAAAVVSEGIIYINSNHPINRSIFGINKIQFDDNFMNKIEAKIRYAEVILDVSVFYTAQVKERTGGEKGIVIRPNLAVQSIQSFIDEHKFKLSPKVYTAIVPSLNISIGR